MIKRRLDAAIGIASGLAQGTTIVHAQTLAVITLSLGLPAAELAWLAPVGFAMPLIANVLMSLGDWLSTKALCLWTAAITVAGSIALALAGLMAAQGWAYLALWLVSVGSVAVPAALRHGDLVVAHLTARRPAAEKIRAGRALRAYLVVGIYGPAVPAGLVVQSLGWPWVFAFYAAVNAAGLLVLARTLGPSVRRSEHRFVAYQLHFLAQFKDRLLLLTATAAMLVRAIVFAWVTGVATTLTRLGYAPVVVGLVAGGGLLAAPFVGWQPARRRRGATAGGSSGLAVPAATVPAVIALVLGAGTYLTGEHDAGGAGMGAYLALAILASALAELAKQIGQLMTTYQATLHAREGNRFRRLAVANLGGNVGAMLGASLGPLTAIRSEVVWWAALCGLAVLYITVQVGWSFLKQRRR